MIMAVAALLKDNRSRLNADIDSTITNICRCGTYQQCASDSTPPQSLNGGMP